jgi:hypothetical protein
MKAMWKQGRVSKDWFADYRGLSARVRVDPESGKATEISWYISGKVEMVSPVRVTVDVANRIATKVIDHQIASEAKWAQAEQRWQRGLFLRR